MGKSDVYSNHGRATSDCPSGTMFEPGFDEFTQGFLVGAGNKFSVMDHVQVPSTAGEYVLSWRWDCEETDQVWNSCADIVITDDVPPTPTPTPAPPSPPPSPSTDTYVCYLGQCYNKGSYGKTSKEQCESQCASPGKGDWLCWSGKCYEKPGYGKLDKDTCESTCTKTFLDHVVV